MMDILLSLPILSFFFSTSATSWSTSLNLLFFYMTWSTLVLSHNALHIQIFGALAIRLVFFLLPALLFLSFDLLLPSLAETIKYDGADALPPRDPKLLAKQLLLALFNIVLQSGLEAGVSLGLTYVVGPAPPFRTTTTLPLPFAIIKQLGWLYLAREVLGYYLHRRVLHAEGGGGSGALGIGAPSWLRLPRIPLLNNNRTSTMDVRRSSQAVARDTTNYLAQKHAAYAHARAAPPYALCLATDHPLPYLVHRFAPTYLPALALRPHLLVYFLFVGLITFEETLTMSGYTIVPGIVMGGITRRNAAHYSAGHHGGSGSGSGSGNYGAWGVLDWGCGTGLRGSGRDWEGDVRAEARKHRVRERGAQGAGEAMDKVGNGLRKGAKGRKGRQGSSGSGS